MIEGIEVLNKVPVMAMESHTDTIINIALITCVLGLIVLIVGVIGYLEIMLTSGGVIAIISFIIVIIGSVQPKVETGRYEYQCIISDEVSFVDIYGKYEVVSKDGKLWTIRDREVKE